MQLTQNLNVRKLVAGANKATSKSKKYEDSDSEEEDVVMQSEFTKSTVVAAKKVRLVTISHSNFPSNFTLYFCRLQLRKANHQTMIAQMMIWLQP